MTDLAAKNSAKGARSMEQTAQRIAKQLTKTTRAQISAADPKACAWVSANAGTGKTHVLTNRVLRLMLAGAPPERILCLTYTKAAAAEMSSRVFERLAGWVTESDEKLGRELSELLGRASTDEERVFARRLFTLAIETPGGLKVQTIHAFCERLLQRFPLEAGVPPGFAILDEDQGATLRKEAIDSVLRQATARPDEALGQALSYAITYAANERFDDVLGEALSARDWLYDTTKGVPRSGSNSDESWFATAEADLRQLMGVPRDANLGAIDQALADCISAIDLDRLVQALSEGSKTDITNSTFVRTALGAKTRLERANALGQFFLTSTVTKRARLMTKKLADAHPDLEQIAQRAQETFHSLRLQRTALAAVSATAALLRLASEVMQRYSEAKARRAALDFDDLILSTTNLLESGDASDWILFKLDGGIDHILVDESQDTSPMQWRIVESLAREFFAGSGARDDDSRTIFAVGDEKQSIYSFQGAAPEEFGAMGAKFRELAEACGQKWRDVPLNLSFRTVTPILEAVDDVFSTGAQTAPLGLSGEFIEHVANRFDHGGLIEVWPTEKRDDPSPSSAWSPLEDTAATSPVTELANRIAEKIRGWLDNGEQLLSLNRNLRAGDVLILVRKRNPFAGPMVSALKALDIPVAGADRIDLLQQISVQDLVALGDFLTLPEDDLSLASVLKSPMFGLDDDDLFKIAHGRSRKTLWKALLDQRGGDDRFQEAIDTLIRWRSRADFIPPYEFFAHVLEREGMRERMLARLGAEAADPIDEFVNLTIGYDDSAPPSLTGFLAWLRGGTRAIKRDMEHGQDQVRVMTVHGAKGLEAPVVFLPDTCSPASTPNRGGLVELADSELGRADRVHANPRVWQIKGASRVDAISAANQRQAQLDRAEHNRLLYVAMTRARDRLYVSGFETARGRARDCWYDLIQQSMERLGAEHAEENGRDILRLQSEQLVEAEAGEAAAASFRDDDLPLPEWALRKAASEPQLTVPLAPSQLAPYETDDEGEVKDYSGGAARTDESGIPYEPAGTPPVEGADNRRFLRGTLTHALLQYLPEIKPARRRSAAVSYVDRRAPALNKRTRASIVEEAMAILEHSDFAILFGPKSRAEVSVAAEIPHPSGKGPALRLSGQIDRLVVNGDEVLIVDYKTNLPPPEEAASVADAYLFQLAAYSLALEQIYPGKSVRAAIVWTHTARIMGIPDTQLAQFRSRLWELDPSRVSLT